MDATSPKLSNLCCALSSFHLLSCPLPSHLCVPLVMAGSDVAPPVSFDVLHTAISQMLDHIIFTAACQSAESHRSDHQQRLLRWKQRVMVSD